MTATATDAPPAEVRLEVHLCAQRRSIIVTFATETAAVDYLERKSSTCAFHELEEEPIPQQWERLLDALYPTCHHGMALSGCSDPVEHWGPELDRY